MPASRDDLCAFLQKERYAVLASVSATGVQAAIVGIAVSDSLEIVFDTMATSRKAVNLRRNPAAALVAGDTSAGATSTLQIEGWADEPEGADLARLRDIYLAKFPDGRERQKLPGLTYFRIRPRWMRWSDFALEPAEIVEFAWDDSDAS